MAPLLLLIGVASAVTGAFMVSIPAGLIVAGVMLAASGADLGRDRR
jgi:hypothetical protein